MIGAGDTSYVVFERHTVAIGSDLPEIRQGLAGMFTAMLAPAPIENVGALRVSRKDGRYEVQGNAVAEVEDGSLADVLRCIRFAVIEMLMEARPDLLWFHAGAVASAGRAVLLPGARGRGKSTLVLALCDEGWSYLSDDIVPLEPGSGRVVPFPQTPAFRRHPGREMTPSWLREARKTEVRVAPSRVTRQPVAVGALVFPGYRAGATAEASACSPAHAAAEMLSQCWNLSRQRGAAVKHVCDLARRTPAVRLLFGENTTSAALTRTLEEWCQAARR